MNRERRKQLDAIISELSEMAERTNCLWDRLEVIRDEESDYYDNMPESIQMGEKGEKVSGALHCLDGSMYSVGTAVDNLSGAAEHLETAKE